MQRRFRLGCPSTKEARERTEAREVTRSSLILMNKMLLATLTPTELDVTFTTCISVEKAIWNVQWDYPISTSIVNLLMAYRTWFWFFKVLQMSSQDFIHETLPFIADLYTDSNTYYRVISWMLNSEMTI